MAKRTRDQLNRDLELTHKKKQYLEDCDRMMGWNQKEEPAPPVGINININVIKER